MAEEKKNAVAKAAPYKVDLQKIQEIYISSLESSLVNIGMKADHEQRACAISLLSQMQQLCKKDGLTLQNIDQTNVMDILQTAVMLRLNTSAVPRECYLIIRNQKQGDEWHKVFEFGIEGDGNDKLVRRYGVNVAKIYPYWLVREEDGFTYASFNGLEMVPPTWTPKGMNGKVVRVVYPIEYQDGTVQYHIAEREGVVANLQAHIINNTKTNKSYNDAKKAEIRKRLEEMTLDQIFNDAEFLEIMSPAWREPHSRESMIIRKMRNNALKPIPKDFSNAYIAEAFEDTYEDYDQYRPEVIDPQTAVDAEVVEKAGTEELKSLPETAEPVLISKETGEVEEVPAKTKKAAKRPF